MLGLGKKTPPPLDRFPRDKWTVAQGVADGRPMIVRVNAPALVITSGGKREFVYYVPERAKVGAAVGTVQAQSPSHQITYGFVDDPSWSYYGQFA